MTAVEAGPVAISADELLSLYEQMAVIRRTEKAAHDLFLAGLVKGTTHLAAGSGSAPSTPSRRRTGRWPSPA